MTGCDVRGTDRDRAAEMVRDDEVERTEPGAGVIDPTPSLFPRAAGGATKILVSLFKVKGINGDVLRPDA